MRHPLARWIWLTVVALVVAAVPVLGLSDDRPTLRDGFESDRPAWRQEQTDVTVNLLDHDRSIDAAHEGRRSERFHFEAGPGSAFYYSYPLRKVPVAADLEVNLYVRSDHTGVQLFARVILPADVDPDTGQPSFLLLPGSVYETTERWQRLNLGKVHDELERRVRVLRSKTKRPVSIEGAYLDRLVINLYGGPGESMVYLDDLSITPVPQDLAVAKAEPGAEEGQGKATGGNEADVPIPVPAPAASGSNEKAKGSGKKETAIPAVVLERNRLFKGGKDWVFSSIRAPGADLKQLYRHGFDVLEVDLDGDPKIAREAVNLGFLLMPGLGRHPGSLLREPPDLLAMASEYSLRDSVAFWNVGEQLGSVASLDAQVAEKARVRALIDGVRILPDGGPHLTTATVAGLFPEFARPPHNLDLIGVDFPTWGTVQEIRDYSRYLAQRRDLTAVRNPEALHWAVINTAPPEEVHQAVWGFDPPASWGIARVQPEQVRLYTYAALQAGYRGLAFHGDADLTRAAGRPLLIEMALLNAELGLFESIIAQGFDPIPQLPTFPPDPPIIIIYTSPGTMGAANQAGSVNSFKSAKQQAKTRPEMPAHPSVTAASISTRDNKGKLLVIADLAQNGQWQPSQMAINDLQVRVPGAPDSAQAYEITLGGVNVLDHERGPGGIQIPIKYFNTTSLVLVTTDRALVERIEAAVASVRSVAIQMAIEQARLQYAWVSEINGILHDDDHKSKDAKDLLGQAERSILSAEEALARAATTPDDYVNAWTEARRAGAPLRLLMYDYFVQGLTKLVEASTPRAERLADAAEKASKIRPYTKERLNAGKVIPRKPNRILSPVSAPPALAFNTLPQLFVWTDWIKDAVWGKSLLPSGLFDDPDPDAFQRDGWTQEGYAYEGVSTRVSTIAIAKEKPSSPRFLKLSAGPAEGVNIDSLPPFLDAAAVAITSPAVQVSARQMVRISVRVKKPKPQPPGAGGLIVRDSLGGEPLQYRNTNAIPDWAELILYRRAPADGPLTVTLGLAGFGEAYFDDLKIEVLKEFGIKDPAEEAAKPDPNSPAESAPRPRRPSIPTARARTGNRSSQ
ncbi:MAG TPA: hypothetical protein VGZ22_09550 [Isosphaeraceae bacterium]|jgi:hypothetical protein|nr:hypothetical protein [Isosphaeraceae bacterium]